MQDGDPLALYGRLRRRQPVPFGALITTDDGHQAMSFSPELMLARRGDRLFARPMKGTAARGLTRADDDAAARARVGRWLLG